MWVSVEQQFVSDGLWRAEKDLHALRRQLAAVEVSLRQDVVDLGYQRTNLRDELDEPFGQQHDAVALALVLTPDNHRHNVTHDVLQGHVLLLDFFANEDEVGARLHGALECDVGSGPAHESDEVVVLLGGGHVGAEIADELRVGLDGRVKAERRLHVLIAEVAVDRLGHTDHLGLAILSLEEFGEDCGVCVGVVAADDHEAVQIQLLADLQRALLLFGGFDFVSTGADHVEASLVAELVHQRVIDLDVLVREHTMRTSEEAEDLAVGVALLGVVVYARDDVVSAGCLSARQHEAQTDGLVLLPRTLVLARTKLHELLTPSFGEEFCELFCVAFGCQCRLGVVLE
mmetsp:Transcript_25335/g.62740  ORF Transcript_25335/g.62740 Transcript_25335/m.62740 type:complete len:344 (-) Transcript_25335:331-1362(-)